MAAALPGTRHLNLSIDDFPNEKTSSGRIAIAGITDSRHFEDKPRSPSTPSVDGTLAETSKEKLAKRVLVSAYGINRGQYASNANWELVFKRAMNNYLADLDKALDSEGL